jgi:DUF2075 family protein
LQIRDTSNPNLDGINYDFRIFSSAKLLREEIILKNNISNKARMVAGYCWDWKSKKNPEAFDVILSQYDFKMKWNLTSDGSLWIIGENSINEIGCIHTCQGLELEYIGVIVGLDLIARNGIVVTNPAARSRGDKTIVGYKKQLLNAPEVTRQKLDLVIKNTYRTLMTRGMKGCYVHFVDKETEEYFKSVMG